MPLTYTGQGEQAPITEAHERARKIKPQYTSGDLVKVAGGRNLAEAEMIQGILLEEGIPSVQRRTRGFDVPDFLAAGPRDILVPHSAREAAGELLAYAGAAPTTGVAPSDSQRAIRLLVGLLVAFGLAAVLVWGLYQLTS